MASPSLFIISLLLFLFAGTAFGVLFSSLPKTLVVKASPKEGTVVRAGEDSITVTWGVNQSLASGVDDKYKKVKVELCYAPISQQDRAWRKTEEDLTKDKTCQFNIVVRAYSNTNKEESFVGRVEKDVPTATYFVRAYAVDSDDKELAYGQTTDAHKITNLFEIQAISGRHVSLDIAAACFSAFSVISLFGFFFLEKRQAKVSSSST